MDKSFHCIQCGECCRNIKHIPELRTYHNGDGICIHLNSSNNLCNIYNHRPIICNVQKAYTSIFASVMTQDEYIKKNQEGCKNLWEMKQKKKRKNPKKL